MVRAAALRSTTSTVSAVAPSLVSQIAVALVKQCNESLRPSLRSVLTEVRASIKSAPPSTPSYLVPRVLKPLKSFFDHFPGRELDTPSRAAVAGEVLDEIAGRYASVLVDNREAEASLRRLKRGRQGFSLFGRSTPAITDADGGGEEINVKVQLQLDAESFEQEAMALDVKIDEGAGFKALRAAVH